MAKSHLCLGCVDVSEPYLATTQKVVQETHIHQEREKKKSERIAAEEVLGKIKIAYHVDALNYMVWAKLFNL